MSFFEKFFGYFRYADSEGVLGLPEPYKDGLGDGAFSDIRHILWILVTILLAVGLYMLFSKNHKAGKYFVVIACGMLFTTRLCNQIYRAAIGAEYPAWRAFPFHMCTVLSFLMPIVAIFKIDKIKTPVYTLAIMGGVITIIIGDYFDNRFLTFATLEGMSAHTLLVLVPIIEVAIGGWSIKFKNSWQTIVGIIILMLWATLANKVFFADYDTNYMYLVRNALPGNIGGDYFILIYALIFFILLFLINIVDIVRIIKGKIQK